MGTAAQRPVWALLCLVAVAAKTSQSELKQAAATFTLTSGGADGWLPMVRPAGLSSAAASMVAAAAAAAAVSADPPEGSNDGRQRALQHPVMGRIQQHLSATPKRLLRPTFDGFLGGSNKVEVFAPPPASLLTTFGQAGIRKPPGPGLSAQESRFAAFEQSAPSIFFVQPPPAPANPSVFTLPPHQHHGSFPLFPAQQPSFFRPQPQHEFRYIPEQSSFSGLTHSFIPPVDRTKQQLNRYLPSVGQTFEIHPNRQPLVRPLVPSPQYNEDTRPSLAPITFPPQRSSPAPFKPFPEQRLPFLQNDAHQPQFQQQFQHQPFQQQFQQHHIQQQQIQQPPILQQQQDAAPIDQNQSHLQQRPIEKLRITRPYFEETRPTVSNANYGPQTFPTPHAFADFPPTSFFFPEPTQTEPPTTTPTTTTTTTTEVPEMLIPSPVPLPHVNEVQSVEQLPETPAPPKRKSNHHRRRKPNRVTTTTTTPVPDVSRDDDFSDNPPPSVLPESVQYQQEVPLPPSDPTFETVGTYQPPSVEPTQYQNESPQFQNERPQFQNERPQSQNERPQSQNERPQSQNERPQSQNERTQSQNERAQFQNERAQFQNERAQFQNERPQFQNERPQFQNERPQIQNERHELQNEPLQLQNEPLLQNHFQEQSASDVEPSPTLAQAFEPSFLNHENAERISSVPSTEAPISEEPPATLRPRRKKPTGIRHRIQEQVTTTPAPPPEILNHQLSQDIPAATTLTPQPEPTTETPAPSSTTTTISSRLRPRIRFNSTRPSFSLKEYRGRLNKPTTPSPDQTETSSPTPVPSAIPPRVRYPSRVRSPYRPSTTDEPSTSGNEPTRTKSRFNPRYRTSTTTPTPDTASSPTETSETKTFHFKANMTRFRPGTGKYVSRFRLTSTTETAVTERTSRMPIRTTGVYSVRRPAPTEATEVASVQLTAEPPTEEKHAPAESEDLESHPSNQPFSEFTPESRSTTSSEIPIEPPSPETPADTSENYPEMTISNVQPPSKVSYGIPDMTAEAISVPPPEIHIDGEAPSEESPIQSETPGPYSTPPPKPTGTALEQDNEVLPAPAEPVVQQTDVSLDDMMLSPSSRVADLTSSPNNKYDNPQLRLKSAIPPRISLSTDDPILPIEAFFNSWNKKSS